MEDQTAQEERQLSSRVQSISESSIRTMFNLAEKVEDDLIRLEVGDPDFTTPSSIITAAHDAAHNGETHYTSNAGMPALRRAIADEVEAGTATGVDLDNVVVTNGAMEALYLSLLAVVDQNEDVVIPTPAWPNYTSQTQLVGGNPVHVHLNPDNDFDLDAEAVIDSIGPETAAVILNTPCNPSGRVFSRTAVEAVVESAAKHDAYVIADEVYEGFVYDSPHESIMSSVDTPERVITVSACSKKYAMTGWRLGWLVAPRTIAEAATTLHQSTSSCAPSISQQAALAAITGDQTGAEKMYNAFNKRRDFVVDRVDQLPVLTCTKPQGAFYTLLNVAELEGQSFDIAKRLMYDYGVVTAPGSGFGEPSENYLRISFANSLEQIKLGFDGIEEMVRTELGIDDCRQ